MFYEPLWFFHRGVLESGSLEALRGRKISVGPEGSGTQALARELLARNGIDQQFAELLPLSPQEAAEKLVRGEIDAAIMLAAWNSSVVRRLLTEETIRARELPACGRLCSAVPFLNKLTVPAGVGDLAKNRPPRDVTLLAPKASLVVRRNLHPAIQSLLLDAAEQIHSGPTIFQQSKQFPAPEAIDLPLSSEARQFYRSGRSFLERHLPFWLAVTIGRLLVLLIPLIGLIYPLFRLMPALYAWEVRWRIFRMYRELRLLEKDAESPGSGRPVDELTEGLDRLEAKASRLQVPLFYTNLLYTLRAQIALVRGRLTKAERKPIAE